MSIRYLYEFDYNNAPTQRFVEGNSVQTLTYTWIGIDSIEESEYYLNITDTRNSNFSLWIQDRGVDKLFVTRHKYNTETETDEEITRNLYTNVNVDSTTVSLRKSSIPEEQLLDAQQLLADGIVQLYEIKLSNGTYLHLKSDNSVSWNNYDWRGIPILFEGYSSAKGSSYSRPTLSIANPDGAFSTFVRDGFLDRAEVTRYLVLYDDLINDRPIYQKKTWVIWYIKTLNKNMIQVELRNWMDGVNFDVPARMYIPPEFPFVTLK